MKPAATEFLDGHPPCFQELSELGRATAKRWLAENYDAIGVRGTLDLKAAYS